MDTPSIYDRSFLRIFTHFSSSRLALCLAGTLLMALAAQFTLPFYPVPLALHPFVALLIGLTYTPSCAWQSLTLWCMLGVLGLPFFAGGTGGLGVLLGPRGGYILGLTVAPFVMAWFRTLPILSAQKKRLLSLGIGQTIIFGAGLGVLKYWVGSWGDAIQHGFLLFLPAEAIRTALLGGFFYKQDAKHAVLERSGNA